jgi:hypothetical protein
VKLDFFALGEFQLARLRRHRHSLGALDDRPKVDFAIMPAALVGVWQCEHRKEFFQPGLQGRGSALCKETDGGSFCSVGRPNTFVMSHWGTPLSVRYGPVADVDTLRSTSAQLPRPDVGANRFEALATG